MALTELEVYLVGGAVRDELLGLPLAADRDWVVVGANPEDLLQRGFLQIGNDFPCFLHPQTKEEYALARTERKSGSGHTGFVCDFSPDITLEEDLSRRDLTINAIAKSPDGDYIDPYGGMQDLKQGVLRHVSDAFSEDPLRVLRVARFAARLADRGFRVHPDTLALMRQLAESGELQELTAERVWKEVSRALTEVKPSEFFQVLRACAGLKVILPELDCLFGIPQPIEHHPEIDTGVHVMMCIDQAKRLFDTPLVTWATLVHDLGKGLTPRDEWPQHIGHEKNGVPLVEQVAKRLKVPRDYLALGKLVAEHHLRCHRMFEMRAGSIMKLLEALDALRKPERVAYFAQACEADARGRPGWEEIAYPQAQLLLDCAQSVRSVDIKPLLEKGYQGLDLARQIRHLRIAALNECLKPQL